MALLLRRMRGLGLEFGQDPSTGQGNTRPSDCRQGMSLKKETQQHRKDLPGCRNRTQHQRIKGSEGVKDEGLPNGAANGELADFRKNFRIALQEG